MNLFGTTIKYIKVFNKNNNKFRGNILDITTLFSKKKGKQRQLRLI